MNTLKSPYITGALCGTFYQAATSIPFSGIIPIALAFAIPIVFKSFDNDAALQLRQSTVPKIIDKRPYENAQPTTSQLIKFADKTKGNAQKWFAVLTTITLVDGFMRARHGENPLGAINPISLGLIADQTTRYMRFNQIIKRNWVMHDKAPKKNESLHPTALTVK